MLVPSSALSPDAAGEPGAALARPTADDCHRDPMPLVDNIAAMSPPLDDLVRRLRLSPHPEGGWFRELYRDNAVTTIYYVMAPRGLSPLHRLRTRSELWHFYGGAPVELHTIDESSDASAHLTNVTTRTHFVNSVNIVSAARSTTPAESESDSNASAESADDARGSTAAAEPESDAGAAAESADAARDSTDAAESADTARDPSAAALASIATAPPRNATHRVALLSPDAPLAVVPPGVWQAARVIGDEPALLGCTVAPAFDFADWQMPSRAELLQRFPLHSALVAALTRP